MSRLPRLIEPQAAWLGALRAALRRMQRLGATLVTTDGTAGVDFARRGAERLTIDVEVLPSIEDSSEGIYDVNDVNNDVPERDRRLMAAAEMVIVLGLRTNGCIHRLLRLYLESRRSVMLVDLPGLQSQAARDELVGLGATLWNPTPKEREPLCQLAVASVDEHQTDGICEIVPVPVDPDWAFLSHTTRSCPGPWPAQSPTEYFDALLDESPDADHSALATLKRIIGLRLLRASSRLIRGGFPMVCLTQTPLTDLPRLRQFRAHRTRWDFEPFGMCINREWLQERGARPVVYGDEVTWERLADTDRPFFQFVQRADTDDKRHVVDWTVEQEWRHAGHLDLQALPADAAYVFVPNFEAARVISRISPWPVTLWPGG